MKRAASFLCLLVGLSPSLLGQNEEDIAAKILSVQGQVEVEQSPWAPARADQILYAGNKIRTGAKSRVALLLADETQVKLSANSELELRQVRQSSNLLARLAATAARADQSVINVGKGRAWLRSKKKPAAVRVGTPSITAAIRGTEFDIRVAEDGETVATVVEGVIDFSNELGSVTLNPGEQGRCRVGEAPTKTVILNPEDAVQWTLFYSASVSPRDFPFVYDSPQQAQAALSTATADPLTSARIQHDAGDLEAALASLGTLSSAGAAEIRGWIYLEQNQISAAIEQLDQADQSTRSRLGLSLAHFRVGEFEEAYRYVEDPGTEALLKIQKGMLDLLVGDVEMAEALLESISPSDASYTLAQGMLSNVQLAQNDKDAALISAQQALQTRPTSPSGHLNLSLVQQSFFDLPGATRSAERALELDPKFLQARVQYAKLLFGAGDSGQAEEVLRAALAEAPEEASVHSALGFVLLARGDTEEARTSFDRSLQLDSTRGEPHLGLGIAEMRGGQLAAAVLEMLEATTLEPQL